MFEKINTKEMKEKLLNSMAVIAKNLKKETSSAHRATYNDQRAIIKSFFNGKEYGPGVVMTRLVIIDSLYSTNAAYSYFSFDEMAENICSIGNEDEARNYFYKVVRTCKDDRNLFGKGYGIHKNLDEGSKQMSLLSKYAYYALIDYSDKYPLGFPIYDSLAKEAYPTVCAMLGEDPVHKLPTQDTPKIGTYIECLQQLREELFGDSTALFHDFQQYDILDAYLWRMGKFENGNLSLLLDRGEYVDFVKKIGINAKWDDEKGKFVEKDTVYRNRMIEEHMGESCVSNEGKFDFGKAVMAYCYDSENSPFAGTTNETYMNKLLAHWREFHGMALKAAEKTKKQ